MADAKNAIEVYKAYFDLWTQTREERTAYNKYFLSLLFIDTLVAVFTAVLGTSKVTVLPGLTRILLLGILVAGAFISLVWACKLFALNVVEGSQQDVLKEMESHLQLKKAKPAFALPFVGLGVTAAKEASKKETSIGMEQFQLRQDLEAHKNIFFAFFWWASFWVLPILFILLFALLAIYLYLNPVAIPLPS